MKYKMFAKKSTLCPSQFSKIVPSSRHLVSDTITKQKIPEEFWLKKRVQNGTLHPTCIIHFKSMGFKDTKVSTSEWKLTLHSIHSTFLQCSFSGWEKKRRPLVLSFKNNSEIPVISTIILHQEIFHCYQT